ncbi:alpha/beta hydrolase [Serratia sp. Se-RSmG]|nr:alpha/beta hydrolase [Serratia sp. Se-RSmG]MDI6949512.1 alpha/beta hydrolase [Serratia sp. Se-RSmG]
MEELPPNQARTAFDGLQGSVKPHLAPVDIQEKSIVAEGRSIRLIILRPKNVRTPLPAFMFFHGGGWVLGSGLIAHEALVRKLVDESGAAAVFVDYSLSPEARYPVAINEAFAATKWISSNGKQVGIDGSRLAVVGNSAGGNMAAVVALRAKEEGAPKLRLQVLLWPITSAAMNSQSYTDFSKGHYLTKSLMQWFWNNYADPKQRSDVYASPLNATPEQLSGVAPALIQTAEMDVLRDEGEQYARKLRDAGIDVVATRNTGVIHDFATLNALQSTPAARASISQIAEQLKSHLDGREAK